MYHGSGGDCLNNVEMSNEELEKLIKSLEKTMRVVAENAVR